MVMRLPKLVKYSTGETGPLRIWTFDHETTGAVLLHADRLGLLPSADAEPSSIILLKHFNSFRMERLQKASNRVITDVGVFNTPEMGVLGLFKRNFVHRLNYLGHGNTMKGGYLMRIFS